MDQKTKTYWKNVGYYYLLLIGFIVLGYLWQGHRGAVGFFFIAGFFAVVVVGHHIGMYFYKPSRNQKSL